jgi:hypothetical protein
MKNGLLRVGVLSAGLLLLAAGPGGAVDIPTSNLRVWLKADAISGLNSGDLVTNWPDSSGLGFDAAQTNATRQPYYYSNVVNGLPVVRFSRTNDYLMNQAYTNPIQEVTVFMVAHRLGNKLEGSYSSLFIGGAAGFGTPGNGFYQLTHEWNGPDIRANFYLASLDITNANLSWPTNDFTLLGLMKGAGFSQLSYNGALKGAGTGAQNLGSGYYLGCWFNNAEANMEVAELAIYGSALSTNARQTVEGILAVKYGINGFLPTNHPWYNGTPTEGVTPSIENRPATTIGLTNASLNGHLSYIGSAPAVVSVVWGTANGGSVTSGLWQATNTWAAGAWSSGNDIAHAATDLASNRYWYYRYAATNTAGFSEATNVLSFMTAPIEVTVDDAAGVEGEDTLAFTLTRPATATNESVTIPFAWSGTAQGADYVSSTHPLASVVLSAGKTATNVTVFPVDDPGAEPEESVVFSLSTGGLFVASAASVTGSIAASTAHAPTNTIGYWRFEPIPGLQGDSSGNGHHLSTAIAATNQKALAASGFSSAFPHLIYDSGRTNATCLTSRGLVPYDPVFTARVFTVEGFVAINDTNSGWKPIAARWRGLANTERSWIFGVVTNAQRLTFLYYSGGSITVLAPTADFDIQTNKDYYLSVSVDFRKVGAGQNGALFRLKNLTDNGPFLSGYADLPSGSLQPAVGMAFEIRQYGEVGATVYGLHTGWLDELRFSSGVLADKDLMINAARRPGSMILIR